MSRGASPKDWRGFPTRLSNSPITDRRGELETLTARTAAHRSLLADEDRSGGVR